MLAIVNKPWRQAQLFNILLVAFAVFVLLHGSSLASQIWNNAGWLQLAQVVFQRGNAEASANYFSNALLANSANYRASLGAGMIHASVLDETQALHFWKLGNTTSELLAQLGDQARDYGLKDVALIYYRNSSRLEQVSPSEADFRAAKLCQQSLAVLTALSPPNSNYCQGYFIENNNNLLLDGQFNHRISWSWGGTFFFKDPTQSTVDLDRTVGTPAPSLALTGRTSGRHLGVYQRVPLAPGTTVQFSGRFRAKNAGDLSSWLLYIEWRQQGKSQGSHLYTVNSDMEWRELERAFTLPLDSEPWVQFYPVLLIGQGTVWADDVRVEILSDNK